MNPVQQQGHRALCGQHGPEAVHDRVEQQAENGQAYGAFVAVLIQFLNASTIYTYENWGEMEFDLSFPVVPGMQYMRTTTVSGGEEIKYTDRNAFIADYFDADAVPAAGAPADEAKEESAPVAAESVAAFAGEYEVILTNQDGVEMYFEEFIIEEDGTVHGAVEGSGLTGFEGVIDIYGRFTCEQPRLGGTMTGTVDLDGNLKGESEARGRLATYEGHRYDD